MLDALHEQMYRALVTHGGHTHGVHHPQNCPTCEAAKAYLVRLAAQEAIVQTPKTTGKG